MYSWNKKHIKELINYLNSIEKMKILVKSYKLI